jgi:hypothetical protein
MKLHSILVAGLLAAVVCQGSERSFQLTFRVIDDEQRPMAGAKVQASWENAKASKPSERIQSVEGITGPDGRLTLEGKTFDSDISYGANKDGSYAVWGQRYHFKEAGFLRWQPWNPLIEVVLKRKKNPVPMYAKGLATDVPAAGLEVGYDLIVGDWLAPYGRGRRADVVMRSEGEVRSDRNYQGQLMLAFPGSGNGFVPFETSEIETSPLRMPYEAPEKGYETTRTWRSIRRYNSQTMRNEEYVDDSSKILSFFIRIRSEVDAEGRVVKAMYGKIHAPFIFDARGIDPWGKTRKQYVSFTYYVNPDGTRNIEFDPKRNLLNPSGKDLPEFRGLAP